MRACTKNQYLGVSRLTADLTNVESDVVATIKAKVEGPVMFRDPEDQSLYLIASG